MPRSEKYFVGPKLLGDIRQVITRVNGIPDKTSGVSLPVRLQDMQRRGGASNVRMCGWTSTWFIDATAVIALYDTDETGVVVADGGTATATNSFFGVTPGSGVVVKSGGIWQLVVARFDQLEAFSGSDIQLLGHSVINNASGQEGDGGNNFNVLHWYSVTQCGTATAAIT